MNTDNLTTEQKELMLELMLAKACTSSKTTPGGTHPLVGKNLFVMTVTLYYTGKVVSVDDSWIVLTNGAWIADTGRLTDFLKDTDNAKEVEIYTHDIRIPCGAIGSMTEVDKLPGVQK